MLLRHRLQSFIKCFQYNTLSALDFAFNQSKLSVAEGMETSILEPLFVQMLHLASRDKVKHLKKGLQRWSSCGSVYIGEGCLSKPDSKLILHCISVAVCSLIKSERMRSQKDFVNPCSADHDPLIICHSDQSPSLTSTYNMENECSIGPEIYREVYEIYDERVHPLFVSLLVIASIGKLTNHHNKVF